MKGRRYVTESKRWGAAQESEKDFWEGYNSNALLEEGHQQKTELFLREASDFVKFNSNTRILEVGCGPLSVINFIKTGKRYSIDPLADFYKKKFKFDYKSTHLQKGTGEKLPFKDNSFDVVLCLNVLDHTHLPEKVLSEMSRVLKKGGIFYFENYFYQNEFLVLSNVFGFLKRTFTGRIFNISHPHMFNLKGTQELLSRFFLIKREVMGRCIPHVKNMEDVKRQKLNSKKITEKIPALFGLWGKINYTSICKKD